MQGRKLGGFELRERLGKGGMGEVYKAFDPGLERFVAVKILPDALAHDDKLKVRFLGEARTLAKLNHPNLVHIYAIGDEKETSYFVMEYINGWTITKLLERWKKLPLQRAFAVIGEIMAALDSVHKAGLVHRDIKPANIMVEKGGRVVLMDFGLAKLIDEGGAIQLTTAGMIIGTPQYVSPEQARGERVDHRSDIYSLGCVLYQLLTGKPPYEAKSAMGVLTKHAHDPVPQIRAELPDIEPEVEKVVTRCLQKAVAERYQDLSEMAADMAQVYRSKSIMGLIPESVRQSLRSSAPLSGASKVPVVELPSAVDDPTTPITILKPKRWKRGILVSTVILILLLVAARLVSVAVKPDPPGLKGSMRTADGADLDAEVVSYDPEKKAMVVKYDGKRETIPVSQLRSLEISLPEKER